ncbi:MAG: GNAT family N-acetyltransferase [Acidimicrobiales bacterium]
MPGAVDVVELGPDGEEAYEHFVAHHPHALIYHSLRFRDFLVDLLGAGPRYGVALGGGGVVGVLPVMAADGPYGTVLNSLPYFGSNGGVLVATPAARAALGAWYDRMAGTGVAAATVVANPLDTGADPPVHDVADVRIGCMTPLSGEGDPDERLTALIDGSARRNVAKAGRSGVQVDVDNGSGFGPLEEMHRAGMDAIGGRAKSPEFFAAVQRCFRPGDDYDVYVARIGDEVVAALLVFWYGAAAEYYVPATRPDRRSEQPMAAILHRALVDAAARGLRWWNWGGSWVSQENLIRFKTKWGGIPREYRYWTRVNDGDLLAAEPGRLTEGYPGFFVVPYASLRAGRGVAG